MSDHLTHATVMIGRSVRLSSRNIEAMMTALMLPIVLMLMFVYIFGGAIGGSSGDYVTYVVPGVILICVGFGSAQTAVSVAADMTGGIIDRFRSMDIGGSAVLTGQVVASVIRNLVATAAVIGVALAIGFRPSAGIGGWLAAIGVLVAYLLAFSWLAAAIGLLAGSAEAASGFTFLVMFLPYPSSALVPIHTMPSWLQPFAEHQPITPVTEAVRDLLLDRPAGSQPWIALAWSAGIMVVSMIVATALYRRRTSAA